MTSAAYTTESPKIESENPGGVGGRETTGTKGDSEIEMLGISLRRCEGLGQLPDGRRYTSCDEHFVVGDFGDILEESDFGADDQVARRRRRGRGAGAGVPDGRVPAPPRHFDCI